MLYQLQIPSDTCKTQTANYSHNSGPFISCLYEHLIRDLYSALKAWQYVGQHVQHQTELTSLDRHCLILSSVLCPYLLLSSVSLAANLTHRPQNVCDTVSHHHQY